MRYVFYIFPANNGNKEERKKQHVIDPQPDIFINEPPAIASQRDTFQTIPTFQTRNIRPDMTQISGFPNTSQNQSIFSGLNPLFLAERSGLLTADSIRDVRAQSLLNGGAGRMCMRSIMQVEAKTLIYSYKKNT